MYEFFRDEIQRIGDAATLEGKFMVDWGINNIVAMLEEGKHDRELLKSVRILLKEIGEEYLNQSMLDLSYYADDNAPVFHHHLAKRINELLGR